MVGFDLSDPARALLMVGFHSLKSLDSVCFNIIIDHCVMILTEENEVLISMPLLRCLMWIVTRPILPSCFDVADIGY
jgi:hypothetical protein